MMRITVLETCSGIYKLIIKQEFVYQVGQLLRFNQSFIYSTTDAPVSCLKKQLKFTLKFALKQLRHVSVLQLHHHQGAH